MLEKFAREFKFENIAFVSSEKEAKRIRNSCTPYQLSTFLFFSFVNSRGLGYTAHFSGPMLVIEVWGKNGKKQTLLVKSKFEPQIVSFFSSVF